MPLEGIAKKIEEVELVGVPFGEAVVGGGSALVLAELTSAFVAPRLPTIPTAAILAGEAYLMSRYGSKVVGAGGARLATLFIGWEAVRALVPLDNWVKGAIAKAAGAAQEESSGSDHSNNPGGNGHHASDGMDLMRNAMLAAGR